MLIEGINRIIFPSLFMIGVGLLLLWILFNYAESSVLQMLGAVIIGIAFACGGVGIFLVIREAISKHKEVKVVNE